MAIDKSDRGWNFLHIFFFFTWTFLRRFARAIDCDRISASKHAIEFGKAIIGFAFSHKKARRVMVLIASYRLYFFRFILFFLSFNFYRSVGSYFMLFVAVCPVAILWLKILQYSGYRWQHQTLSPPLFHSFISIYWQTLKKKANPSTNIHSPAFFNMVTVTVMPKTTLSTYNNHCHSYRARLADIKRSFDKQFIYCCVIEKDFPQWQSLPHKIENTNIWGPVAKKNYLKSDGEFTYLMKIENHKSKSY